MGKKVTPEILQAAKQAAAELQQADATGSAGFAADYVELPSGVRLYRPKVAHQWPIMLIRSNKTFADRLANTAEFVVAMSYILSMDQQQVRNKLIPLARDPKKFFDAAWDWVLKHNLSPDDLSGAVEELQRDLVSDAEDDDAPGEPLATGGGAD